MAAQYPSLWKDCNGGKAAPTDYFPLNCGQARGQQKAQTGSDGVMNYVKSKGAVGSIAMEEYSYPLMANFPVAKVLNKAGYYTLPTQYNVAVALTQAEINDDPKDPNYRTDGNIFATITYGKGQMGPYGATIQVPDRWAIIAYIRTLQLARQAAAPAAAPPAPAPAEGKPAESK